MLKLLTKADAISLLNASFGFLAILFIIINEQRVAVSFIFLALLSDGLDGIIARRFGGGKMGESLEAMADMVSLSLAPLFFVFAYALELKLENVIIILPVVLVGMVFISCSAIRLASFHVLKDNHYFVGLPASVSTILLISVTYFDFPLYSYLILLLILSIMMVSSIKFPKPTIPMNLSATILIVLGITLYTHYQNISFILLLGAMVFYSIFGPFYIKKFIQS
jgi:CDP-diacylglycerol--serine O-phosphatidyltransferase